MKVFIVAGGYSLVDFDFTGLTDRGYVLGIKESVFHTPCHGCLNMDRLWYEHRYEKLKELNGDVYLRDACFKNGLHPKLEHWKLFKGHNKSSVLSDEDGILNGSNSGFCALNLAYQMPNVSTIFLLGFDMNTTGDNSYWYPFYEWNPNKLLPSKRYIAWGKEFSGALSQCLSKNIAVYNVNPNDSVSPIPRISFKDFRKSYL